MRPATEHEVFDCFQSPLGRTLTSTAESVNQYISDYARGLAKKTLTWPPFPPPSLHGAHLRPQSQSVGDLSDGPALEETRRVTSRAGDASRLRPTFLQVEQSSDVAGRVSTGRAYHGQ